MIRSLRFCPFLLAAFVVVAIAQTPSKIRLGIQLGHNANVASVAFSPDGKFALTGGRDGASRVWDIASGREVRVFNSGFVWDAVYSPDGRSVLTTDENAARLWDVAS